MPILRTTIRALLASLDRHRYTKVTSTSRSHRVAKSPTLQRSQWLLLALRASSGGLTPVQLQKVLFLLSKSRPDAVGSGFYRFDPYNYGPFSRDVFAEAEYMAAHGQVEVDESRGRSLRRYRLTPVGQKLAEVAAQHAPAKGVEYLTRAVPYVQSLSFNDLVRAIYQAFPEMRENSVFQD